MTGCPSPLSGWNAIELTVKVLWATVRLDPDKLRIPAPVNCAMLASEKPVGSSGIVPFKMEDTAPDESSKDSVSIVVVPLSDARATNGLPLTGMNPMDTAVVLV